MQLRPLPFVDTLPFAPRRLPPIVLALSAQLLALSLSGLALWLAPRAGFALSLGAALLFESLLAVAISAALRMPAWWLAIQALFVPALVLAHGLGFAPHWYMLGFVLLVSLFWSTFSSQVPLYLSRRQVWHAVAAQLPQRAGLRCIDLGSGLGGWVRHLAQLRRDSHFTGIETAPLPSVIGKLRSLLLPNARSIWGNFWQHDLGEYDVVFAYLSPVPMPDLWDKARREMRPGTLFISYRFAVPGVPPSAVVELQDLGRTQLYLWRM